MAELFLHIDAVTKPGALSIKDLRNLVGESIAFY